MTGEIPVAKLEISWLWNPFFDIKIWKISVSANTASNLSKVYLLVFNENRRIVRTSIRHFLYELLGKFLKSERCSTLSLKVQNINSHGSLVIGLRNSIIFNDFLAEFFLNGVKSQLWITSHVYASLVLTRIYDNEFYINSLIFTVLNR